MKTKITMLLPFLFALTACSSEGPTLLSCNNCTDIRYLSQQHFHATNPANVRIYQQTPPSKNYTSIASISVHHLNSAGEKRAQGVVDDTMKDSAAMLGGNGLINIHHGKLTDSATVIHMADSTAVLPSYSPV